MDFQRKPKMSFIVASDKVEEFLNFKTGSAIDAVNKSKERRKQLIERAKRFKCINTQSK